VITGAGNDLTSNYYAAMKKDQIIFLIGRIQYKTNRFLAREMKAHGIDGLAISHARFSVP